MPPMMTPPATPKKIGSGKMGPPLTPTSGSRAMVLFSSASTRTASSSPVTPRKQIMGPPPVPTSGSGSKALVPYKSDPSAKQLIAKSTPPTPPSSGSRRRTYLPFPFRSRSRSASTFSTFSYASQDDEHEGYATTSSGGRRKRPRQNQASGIRGETAMPAGNNNAVPAPAPIPAVLGQRLAEITDTIGSWASRRAVIVKDGDDDQKEDDRLYELPVVVLCRAVFRGMTEKEIESLRQSSVQRGITITSDTLRLFVNLVSIKTEAAAIAAVDKYKSVPGLTVIKSNDCKIRQASWYASVKGGSIADSAQLRKSLSRDQARSILLLLGRHWQERFAAVANDLSIQDIQVSMSAVDRAIKLLNDVAEALVDDLWI